MFLHRYRSELLKIPFPVTAVLAVGTLLAAPVLDWVPVNEGVIMSVFAWPWVVLLCLHRQMNCLLRSRPLQWLGDLSYSNYLIHMPLAMVFLAANDGASFTREQAVVAMPAYLIAVFTASWMSYRYFETPSRRAIRKWGTHAWTSPALSVK